MNILLEAFPGVEAHLAIFGAGHVGQEIVKLSAALPWQLHWYDSRSDAFDENYRQQARLATPSPIQANVSQLCLLAHMRWL
ncbi:hypothetical protein HSBAA_35670 [Vreelandella sulfidaeris]|uniref:XdhC Rossmann domain-containing protein n=1 Tax=Vreelandella sulfidaeris TaxID=115553 RepID=A0A455UCE2_9GAMM|nr:hypothetical protein HSBAA_35670 [Halomonas sulfidaeris]